MLMLILDYLPQENMFFLFPKINNYQYHLIDI